MQIDEGTERFSRTCPGTIRRNEMPLIGNVMDV
jgi:hypothetical protein